MAIFSNSGQSSCFWDLFSYSKIGVNLVIECHLGRFYVFSYTNSHISLVE